MITQTVTTEAYRKIAPFLKIALGIGSFFLSTYIAGKIDINFVKRSTSLLNIFANLLTMMYGVYFLIQSVANTRLTRPGVFLCTILVIGNMLLLSGVEIAWYISCFITTTTFDNMITLIWTVAEFGINILCIVLLLEFRGSLNGN